MNAIALSDRLLIELQCQRAILEYAELLDAGDSQASVACSLKMLCLRGRVTEQCDPWAGRDPCAVSSRPPRNARHMSSNVLVTAHSDARATARPSHFTVYI